ncbi:MAG: hypothetical protein IKP36_06580 [Bacteroidaceae bacterium]|nr:hypothetical protein [Bacteroidaceae bacterium]
MTIKVFRAYFQLNGIEAGTPAGIKEFVLNFGEEDADAIEEITNSKSSNNKSLDAWFDQNGRKLSGKPTQHGIYIHEGRKVAIP